MVDFVKHTNMRLVFDSGESLKCVFFSLVVKTEALKQKYEGGLRAFVEEHDAWCNKDIVVLFAMGGFDLEDATRDLDDNGLIHGEDYVRFDPTPYAWHAEEGQEIDLGVEWLKGHVQGGGAMVYYSR